jgi:hypothetical protein
LATLLLVLKNNMIFIHYFPFRGETLGVYQGLKSFVNRGGWFFEKLFFSGRPTHI